MSGFRIPMLAPRLVGNTVAYLAECVATNFVSSVGPYVARFERELAEKVGAEYAIACTSGTAALHLCLLALGVGPGDEVIVSDLTFIASANPARYCGAGVVLVDSERTTWNMDPELLAGELRRRARAGARPPAAIVAVHVVGHPALMEPVLECAATHGVPVIEDAAEALGARWNQGSLVGRCAGTVGKMGFFSFNGNKVLTTGGGGMVVTDDPALAERVRHLSTQARIPGFHYDHDVVGYNYRLPNLNAAVGVAQLEQLDTFLESKRALADFYDRRFGAREDITLPPRCAGVDRSAWLYCMLLPSSTVRDRVAAALAAAGIESRPLWCPLHLQAPYRDARVVGDGAVAEDLSSRGLCLPSSVGLSEAALDEVTETVLGALEAEYSR